MLRLGFCATGAVVDFEAAVKNVTNGRCKRTTYKPLPAPELNYTEVYESPNFCEAIDALGLMHKI